ncbi:MAG: fused MFS/spermidine synthase [Cyclobacteriaceae bacterium]
MLQVVWMYRLGLVFGNAAYATAATLAAFFLGLAIGGWFWGNLSERFRHPLVVYGLMEIGVASTALLWIPGVEFYETNYSLVVTLLGDNRNVLSLVRFVFSTLLLFLPTMLMGGTFPVLAQYVGEVRRQLAVRGTVLYAVNTLGASLGAFLAGFFLLANLGVNTTYTIAVSIAAGIGLVAIFLNYRSFQFIPKSSAPERMISILENESTASFNLGYLQFVTLAFFSGLLAISSEIIWTRMFAQVLQNSVYSFSAILVVFLIALGLGGLLSHVLSRMSLQPRFVLVVLLSLGSLMIGVSPIIFSFLTHGLEYMAVGSSWIDYLSSVFGLSILVVLPPTVILGAVFPFLLKVSPMTHLGPGRFVGKLVLFNSIGSAIGPILAGFFLLDAVGVWGSLKIIAILYGGLTLLVALPYLKAKRMNGVVVPIAVTIGIITLTNPPIVKLRPGENILELWQASDGVVSVVASKENMEMRLDNFYILGDSRSALVEQMQGHVPLLIHPDPKKTLFLGMGTGITAGAALNHGIKRVVTVELVGHVIHAAERYFSHLTNGLFRDERSEIVANDARNYLLGTTEKFDVIVGDLFTPWHAGTGSLYTTEHFRQVKNHLTSGGLFAQWLPLYQLTSEDMEIIAASFASVFPKVTLWRADFSASRASIALIGQEEGSTLNEEVLKRNIKHVVNDLGDSISATTDHMACLFYLGNLDALNQGVLGSTLNNDDRRTIEFKAPISFHQASAGLSNYIVESKLENLLTTLATNLPPEKDPYLANLPPNEIRYVEVGLKYFRYQLLVSAGKEEEAKSVLEQIKQLAPDF